jgi:adenylate kinase family enzyme
MLPVQRIIVIGCCGAGKSTVAREVAAPAHCTIHRLCNRKEVRTFFSAL